MTENGLTERGDGVYGMTGRLTFQTVPHFYDQTSRVLGNGTQPITIDMQGVTLADSAGLALLIEWQEEARNAKRELVFTHIPEQMSDLIRVNGLQQMFGFDNGQNRKP